jgi:hypothetical protein
MTERKITYALNKIKSSKETGYHLEAFMRSYLLNVDLIRFILSVASPAIEVKDKKTKSLVNIFLKEMALHPELKSIINKKSLKSLKPWLAKTDVLFKNIKMGIHVSPTALQSESEKIFGILKISANKLLLKARE